MTDYNGAEQTKDMLTTDDLVFIIGEKEVDLYHKRKILQSQQKFVNERNSDSMASAQELANARKKIDALAIEKKTDLEKFAAEKKEIEESKEKLVSEKREIEESKKADMQKITSLEKENARLKDEHAASLRKLQIKLEKQRATIETLREQVDSNSMEF